MVTKKSWVVFGKILCFFCGLHCLEGSLDSFFSGSFGWEVLVETHLKRMMIITVFLHRFYHDLWAAFRLWKQGIIWSFDFSRFAWNNGFQWMEFFIVVPPRNYPLRFRGFVCSRQIKNQNSQARKIQGNNQGIWSTIPLLHLVSGLLRG